MQNDYVNKNNFIKLEFLNYLWESLEQYKNNNPKLKVCTNKRNFMVPFYGWGSTAPRLQSHKAHWQFTVHYLVPRNSWYSFDGPQKDERLSQTSPINLKINLTQVSAGGMTFSFTFCLGGLEEFLSYFAGHSCLFCFFLLLKNKFLKRKLSKKG